ncbi:MAG: poly-beta-hydroxybutyrate polymerase N-terminal domain-containing protein, partial [Burkholderiaceae bacterium]|nr:poly-beta-hydroxybutyrate polymerase N-terminal domain-containing protein [Burkholderiaceae bacterium]
MNKPVDAALLPAVSRSERRKRERPDTVIPQADLMANAAIARITGGISPAAIGNAYADWLTHLAMSPAKRVDMFSSGWRCMRDMLLAARSVRKEGEVAAIIDRRFADPAWQRWPYNWFAAAFLHNEQWWGEAAHGVRGVSRHHADVVEFTIRQWLDYCAPSNFVATNPVVLDETLKSGGSNLIFGLQRMLQDWEKNSPGTKLPADDNYKVGVNVAITKGRVVYRNRLMELIQYAPATREVRREP